LRPALDAEVMNEKLVEIRRDWTPARVLAEYETWVDRQITALGLLQRPLIGSVPIVLPGLGTHPLRLLVNAGVFDVHLHLRNDILGPAGPVYRPIPETPASTMSVVLEWMLAGMPQMCRETLYWVTQPIALELTGPGGGTWSIAPGNGTTLTVFRDDDAPAHTRIVTSALDFEAWSTKRRRWQDYDVVLSGDTDVAARFCESLNIV
jgi:hypothetical protein